MAPSKSVFAFVLLPCIASAYVASVPTRGFGPNWGFATTNPGYLQDPVIMSASTTLLAPEQPIPLRDQLALWPGMDTTGNQDGSETGLVQALAISMTNPSKYCSYENSNAPSWSPEMETNEVAKQGQWFVVASYYNQSSMQNMGDCAFANPGDQIHMSYTYDINADSFNQQVRINNGSLASQFTSVGGGSAYSWRAYSECKESWTGTTPGQTYLNTKIVLRNPDPNFTRFITLANAVNTDAYTTDGGKTWHIQKITINPGFCQTNG